ncbi:hypothetical protein [Azospirillum baldaniorum]|uniref:hypothetical protein n=1 Tax=Azospirillum baldaniorum TaxID=1064539 RepID=UPI0011A309F3|nr:hypothetical protein [Azospirillum baldaniorum]
MSVSWPGLKDLLALLDHWPAWKRIVQAPDRIEELEKRLAELEEKPIFPSCPHCGRPAWQMTESKPAGRLPDQIKGHRDLRFRCLDCGFEDVIRRVPE